MSEGRKFRYFDPTGKVDHYATLGLQQHDIEGPTNMATHEQIEEAYGKLSVGIGLRCKGRRRQAIENAWAVLGDPKRREVYDLERLLWHELEQRWLIRKMLATMSPKARAAAGTVLANTPRSTAARPDRRLANGRAGESTGTCRSPGSTATATVVRPEIGADMPRHRRGGPTGRSGNEPHPPGRYGARPHPSAQGGWSERRQMLTVIGVFFVLPAMVVIASIGFIWHQLSSPDKPAAHPSASMSSWLTPAAHDVCSGKYPQWLTLTQPISTSWSSVRATQGWTYGGNTKGGAITYDRAANTISAPRAGKLIGMAATDIHGGRHYYSIAGLTTQASLVDPAARVATPPTTLPLRQLVICATA